MTVLPPPLGKWVGPLLPRTARGDDVLENASGPPTQARSHEAWATQLDLAWAQGEAYGRALASMTNAVAEDGGEQQAGDYLIGYAIEKAEGMYHWVDGRLEWHEPGDENVHLEITVRDASDGRFVPGVRVVATLVDADGEEVGAHEQPLLWHPMIYHYGRNWLVPHGDYVLHVRVDPPRFSRHDAVNGRRFIEPVEVEFGSVRVQSDREASERRS